MILTERTINIIDHESIMDSPVVLYRGDKNVELKLNIKSSRFKFRDDDSSNFIESAQASYGQLIIQTPNQNEPIFSEITATKKGYIIFVITAEMIDEIDEVGAYTFQVRLLDSNKRSRATIPPVVNGIEIREPITSEDSNVLNSAVVGLASAANEEVLDTFDTDGNYTKTNWKFGDKITDAKLNKAEDGIYQSYALGLNNSSQIKEKADKTEVFLVKDGININDFDEETRRTFLEQQGIDVNYILGKGNVKYENLAKNIKSDFLDGIIYLENLLDVSKFVTGGLYTDGTLNETLTNYYCSDFIPVLPNKKYYRLNTNAVVIGYYDENKNHIDRPTIANGIDNFTIPHNVYYIRYTNNKERMLTEVISTSPVVEYNNYLDGKYVLSRKYKLSRESLGDYILGEPEFLANGFDLNTLRRDGYFVCTDCTNKPENIGIFLLTNKIFLNGTDNVRWAMQEVCSFADVSDRYIRLVDLQQPENNSSWVSLKFSRESLGNSVLGSPDFLSNGFDLNTLNKDGYFVCTDCTNKPDGMGTCFLLNRVFLNGTDNVRWAIQEIYDFTDVSDRYIRLVDLQNSSNNKAWINLSLSKSKFADKKLITLGDSITQGVNASNNNTTYPAYLRNKYGLNVVNKGIAGATWANYNDGYDDISIIHQVDNTDFTNADFVTIFAGTNDFGRDNGDTIGNTTDTGKNTVKGAMNYVIGKILTQNPNVKMAIITPMWRQRMAMGDNKDSDTNTIGGQYLIEYVKAIEEQAKYNHIPCLNLYETCLINKHNYNTYLSDGLHPNDKGYELLADKIHSFLEFIY